MGDEIHRQIGEAQHLLAVAAGRVALTAPQSRNQLGRTEWLDDVTRRRAIEARTRSPSSTRASA